jgi:hypothetical protein
MWLLQGLRHDLSRRNFPNRSIVFQHIGRQRLDERCHRIFPLCPRFRRVDAEGFQRRKIVGSREPQARFRCGDPFRFRRADPRSAPIADLSNAKVTSRNILRPKFQHFMATVAVSPDLSHQAALYKLHPSQRDRRQLLNRIFNYAQRMPTLVAIRGSA